MNILQNEEVEGKEKGGRRTKKRKKNNNGEIGKHFFFLEEEQKEEREEDWDWGRNVLEGNRMNRKEIKRWQW